MTSSDSPPRPTSTSSTLHQRKNSTAPAESPEKENQSPQSKRPLAAPKDVKTVSASSFYATSSSSSKAQPSSAGSSHTVYGESSALPPAYHVKEPTPPFREPELVPEEPPPLIPSDEMTTSGQDWATSTVEWPQATPMPWDNSYQRAAWDTSPSRTIEIDGRVEDEELDWADKGRREKCKRPGPGALPPLLTQLLHNPDHTLYSVAANLPDFANASRASSVTLSGSSISPPASDPTPPPSAEEVRTAVPHPNAYYCKEHNGWVLLLWLSSSVLPPIAPSYVPTHPFPNQDQRRKVVSCLNHDEHYIGQPNMTHHFHKYERAVDARMLTTPYKRSEWETERHRKQRRRKMTIHLDDEGREIPSTSTPAPAPAPVGETAEVPEADMLDLYLCCQCSTYCLVSQVIPGVIPVRCMEEFNKDKLEHPQPGKTGELSLITGWETIITIIFNKLWKNEHRVLPVTRPKFQSKLGWNGAVRRIFESLDCVIQNLGTGGEVTVNPPSVNPSTPEGKHARAKLLRAWIEISAWLTLFHKSRLRDPNFVPTPLSVTVDSATEMIQSALGAHINQIPRGLLPDGLIGYRPLDTAWYDLGLTSTCYSTELLMFAYLAQCRCDPANTPTYFSHFYKIVDTMKELGISPPDQLEMLIGEERSRHRFTLEDFAQATSLLGFGKDGILGVDLDDDVDDDFIIGAWKNAQKRAWHDSSDKAGQLRSDLNDAFKIIAEGKCSSKLREAWDRFKGPTMSEETAYRTLEIPKGVDETMLITIFNLRVEDQPLQADKMREALAVIAEVRDNQRLRDFLSTGRDTDATPENTLDMPRGLNQLGNTCYLNSLLQYFYTIKDLRTTIAALPQSNSKFLDDSKFTDDDLKRHRVGGRMVTRREVQRSKRFMAQLADLFWNLEYCETAAVTPTKELAKLALITSQDEEEDDQGSAGTDTSNDTDATLVDDGPARSSTLERSMQSPVDETAPSASVLGKRGRAISHAQRMDVDGETADVDKDEYVMVSKPSSPAGPASENIASSSKQKNVEHRVEDVEMQDDTHKVSADVKPPPLPPRRPKEVSESVMMFGRQHDVSECMDNCMFQIETALLDFQDEEMENAEYDKTSIVKRLFFGRKRQRLTPLTTTPNKRQRTLSTHEKEDIFSHLHINVSDESFDLYDGLGRYFDDVVDLNGVKKRMEVTLVDPPPLLQIQLQRVQFDRETQQAYKSQAYVKFGETLYLDRFMDTADPDKTARSKEIQLRLNVVRDRIQRLTQGKHAPFAPAIGGVVGFLSKRKASERQDDGEDLVSRLNNEQSLVISELERLRAEAVRLKQEQEAIWENETKAAYELTAVFIHRGASPSFGHYFLYARNLPSKPDQWFKYNDSSVSVISKEEVLADTTGSTANPYMLVFSRRGSEVIDTVRRFDPATLQED